MRIDFKPITKRIELSEYAMELSPGTIDVWVNVTRELMRRMIRVSAETDPDEFLEMLKEIWGEDWPLEDIRALRDHCAEHDPELWKWVTLRTWEAVMEYQGIVKKKSEGN